MDRRWREASSPTCSRGVVGAAWDALLVCVCGAPTQPPCPPRYGTLMLNTEGMTEQGVQRKATCQALFRKLLYLTEHEPLVRADSAAAAMTDLRKASAAARVAVRWGVRGVEGGQQALQARLQVACWMTPVERFAWVVDADFRRDGGGH